MYRLLLGKAGRMTSFTRIRPPKSISFWPATEEHIRHYIITVAGIKKTRLIISMIEGYLGGRGDGIVRVCQESMSI